jgi:hypothetical protein
MTLAKQAAMDKLEPNTGASQAGDNERSELEPIYLFIML